MLDSTSLRRPGPCPFSAWRAHCWGVCVGRPVDDVTYPQTDGMSVQISRDLRRLQVLPAHLLGAHHRPIGASSDLPFTCATGHLHIILMLIFSSSNVSSDSDVALVTSVIQVPSLPTPNAIFSVPLIPRSYTAMLDQLSVIAIVHSDWSRLPIQQYC